METEGSLPHAQVPATCPYPEPDQPSPCTCLYRTKRSALDWGLVKMIRKSVIMNGSRTIRCRLPATVHSTHSQLPSIPGDRSPSATWGRAMLSWRRPTYVGEHR